MKVINIFANVIIRTILNKGGINMKRETVDNLLRNLLVAGNIVRASFDEMKDVKKELDRFIPKIEIEIIKSDFDTVYFRELK